MEFPIIKNKLSWRNGLQWDRILWRIAMGKVLAIPKFLSRNQFKEKDIKMHKIPKGEDAEDLWDHDFYFIILRFSKNHSKIIQKVFKKYSKDY